MWVIAHEPFPWELNSTWRVATLVRCLFELTPVTFAALTGTVHGEELDDEVHGTQWLDLVFDARRDRLRLTVPKSHVNRQGGPSCKSQPAIVNDDPSPGPRRDPMGPAQPCRHGVLVPDRRGAHAPQ
jgi:hypothetical protein